MTSQLFACYHAGIIFFWLVFVIKFSISVPRRYNLLSSIHAWIYPDIQPVPERTGEQWFGRLFTFDESEVPLYISQQSPGEDLEIHCIESEVPKQKIIEKIESILSLNYDIRPSLDIISEEFEFDKLEEEISGIRPYLSDTLYEALVKSIIQQQVSYRAANVLTKRLVEFVASPITFHSQDLFGFPKYTQLLKLGENGLRELGIGFKSPYILQISEKIRSGELNLETLKDSSYHEISKILRPIKGIGDWTIQALLIAGVGDFSQFPYGDLGIQNLLGRIYNNGIRIKKQKVIEISSKWGESGPMVLYLLMCADVLGLLGDLSR
ncbi:MAG: hypothetical protein GF411_12040 [Candidatus Lokiarchaeota archaeon]|nr:hypothetical protein [Candidatus Lokiarchaeota archaeon]